MRSIGVTAVASVLLLAAVVTAPWVPVEHIRTDTGVIARYVMKVEPGYPRVLTQDTRELVIVTAVDVKSRSWADVGVGVQAPMLENSTPSRNVLYSAVDRQHNTGHERSFLTQKARCS